MRTLVNEMEVDLVTAARVTASRAWGTAGTTPFATNLADPAQVRKILDDNGAPPSDRCVVIDTASGAALRTLGQLTKANEAGTTMTLRDGELLNIHGMSFHESAGVSAMSRYWRKLHLQHRWLCCRRYAITLITGTGTILAGDVVTFAGDTNKYVVTAELPLVALSIWRSWPAQSNPGFRNAMTVSGASLPRTLRSRNRR
jgi:hypothetical protein